MVPSRTKLAPSRPAPELLLEYVGVHIHRVAGPPEATGTSASTTGSRGFRLLLRNRRHLLVDQILDPPRARTRS